MKKAVQTLDPNQYIPVRKDFTSEANYRSVVQSAQRRDLVFNQFISFIRTQYNQMKILCQQLPIYNYLVFNQYIRDAFDLINECWSDDLVKYCNDNLKAIDDVNHNPEYQESLPIECSMYQALKFQNLQNQLLEHIKQQNQQIQVFFESAQKYNIERQKTLNYFNPNYLKEPYLELSKLYHFLEESDIKNKKLINKVEKTKVRFLSIFGNFRRVAARNRVLFEKKIYKICAVLVDGIIRVFSQFHNKLKSLKQNLQDAENQQEHSGGSQVKKQKYEFFNKASSDDLFSICTLIRNICDTMTQILKYCKEHRLKFNKKLCQSMKIQDSIPSQAFNFVLETFEKMFSRITQIVNNLTQKIKILEQYQSKLTDLGTSTSGISNYQSGLRKIKVSNVQKTLLIPQIIYGVLDDMIDPLSKLVLWGQTSLAKQKKMYLEDEMNNNHDKTRMSIDRNGEDDYVHDQDMWMFEDWKDFNNVKMPQFSKVREELKKIKDQIDSKKKLDGKQVMQPQKCHLLVSPTVEKKGILYIYQNWIKFVSPEDDELLVIPYQYITNVRVKLQGFKQNLFLYTPRGRVVFINPSKYGKCKQKISERIKKQKNSDNNDNDVGQNDDDLGEGAASATPTAAPKWKSVELTPGEIAGMQAHKAKVMAALPDRSGWQQIHPPHTFKNVTIDQFFFEIHSDKPKQIAGKQWKSFNHYLLVHLGGNTNIDEGKYTTKGPKFYTQQDGETFETCPIFSEKTSAYDHALAGFGLSFLPNSVKCKQTTKVHWVSNEQLILLSDTYSSGVPYADSFYVGFTHHLKKKGDDLEVSFHANVVFVKSNMLKGTFEKKCIAEVKENLPKTIKAQENRIKAVSGGKGKIEEENEKQEEEEDGLVKKDSVKSIGSPDNGQNILYVIGGVIGLLIIIKLLKMIIL